MFVWLNLLLCCVECGRFKGDRFPLADGAPLLVDPTAEDPWDYLDFDPTTGNVVARFDTAANDWIAKGQATVGLLQLDRREAMAAGYRKTYRRLLRLAHRGIECLGQSRRRPGAGPEICAPPMARSLNRRKYRGVSFQLANLCFSTQPVV
jgi:hypothetical protein